MFPILCTLGPLTLHAYGLMVAVGVFAGMKTLAWQASRDGFSDGRAQEALYNLVMSLAIAGILGARIFYVATHWDEFGDNLIDVFKIWQGGLVFYGGIMGACAAFLLWFRKNRETFKDWGLVADWVAPSLAFGHALGRLGCFAAGCCYGKATLLPWRIVFSDPESLAPTGIPLHPTQIYEFLFLAALGFFLLRRLSRTRKSSPRVYGGVFTDYLLLYSAGRFALDFLRGDEMLLAGLTPGQIFSALLFALALFLKIKSRKFLRE